MQDHEMEMLFKKELIEAYTRNSGTDSKIVKFLLRLLYEECVVQGKEYCASEMLQTKIWPNAKSFEHAQESARILCLKFNKHLYESKDEFTFKILLTYKKEHGVKVVLDPEKILKARKNAIFSKRKIDENERKNAIEQLNELYQKYYFNEEELAYKDKLSDITKRILGNPHSALLELESYIKENDSDDYYVLGIVKNYVRGVRNISNSNRNCFPNSPSLEDVECFMLNYSEPAKGYRLDTSNYSLEFESIELAIKILSWVNTFCNVNMDLLQKQYFGHLDLQRLYASNLFLPGIKLNDCRLDLAAFNYTTLWYADFEGSFFYNPAFSHAKLSSAVFWDSTIIFQSPKVLRKGMSFVEAECQETDFSGSYIENAIFYQTDLRGAIFDECILNKCNFSGANLEGTSFKDTIFIDTPEIGK